MLFFRTNDSFSFHLKENLPKLPFPRPFYIAHVISDESRLNREKNWWNKWRLLLFNYFHESLRLICVKIPLRFPFVNFFFFFHQCIIYQACKKRSLLTNRRICADQTRKHYDPSSVFSLSLFFPQTNTRALYACRGNYAAHRQSRLL